MLRQARLRRRSTRRLPMVAHCAIQEKIKEIIGVYCFQYKIRKY